MREMIGTHILLMLSFVIADPPKSDAPPAKPVTGIVILGAVQVPPPNPATATKVSVAPGRFVPITSADGSPSYVAKSPGYRIYQVKKGSTYIGVKYDAKADAEPEEYSWETDVMVLLARNVPGTYSIQLVKNGVGMGPPVENGAPIDLTVQGAIPPPKPVPPKPKPVDPIISPLTQALQKAYDLETDVNRSAQLKSLTEILGAVVPAARASGQIQNSKQLQDKIHLATDFAVGVGKLPELRKAIGAYLTTKLGVMNAPMTIESWSTAATEYEAVVAALKNLKEGN